MELAKSEGHKRLAASALIALAGALYLAPNTGAAPEYLAQSAAVLGAVGLSHAAVLRTITKEKWASIAAALAVAAQVMLMIPVLTPYAQYVLYLAELIGALAVGGAVVAKLTPTM